MRLCSPSEWVGASTGTRNGWGWEGFGGEGNGEAIGSGGRGELRGTEDSCLILSVLVGGTGQNTVSTLVYFGRLPGGNLDGCQQHLSCV